MPGPTTAETLREIGDESVNRLAARVRTGLWLLVIGALGFAVSDLRFETPQILLLHAIKLSHVPLIVLGFAILKYMPTRPWVIFVALLQIGMVCILTAFSGWVAEEQLTAPISVVFIVFIAALILPWGAAMQAIAAALGGASMLLHQWLLNGHIDILWSHDAVIIGLALVSSVFVAWDLERQRRAQVEREVERRTAAHALLEAEQRKSAILETALDGIISIDGDGIVLELNPAAAAMFGYRREETIGRELASLILPEEDRETHRRGLAEVTALPDDAEFIPQRIEMIGRRADGSEFPLEVSVSRSGFGGRKLFTGYIRDLTQRHQAEREQRRLVEILEATTDLVGTTDETGTAIYYNVAGREMLGIGADEDLSALRSIDNIPESYWKVVLEGSTAAVVDGRAWRGEAAMRARDGRVIPVSQVIIAHREASGAVVAFSTIARDISEQKRAEEALQEEALVSGSVARISQELIASLDTPGLNERLCELTAAAMGSVTCRIFLWQAERDGFVAIADHGDAPEVWAVMSVVTLPRQSMANVLPRLESSESVQVALDNRLTGAPFEMSSDQAGFPRTLSDHAVRRGFRRSLYVPLSKAGKLTGFLDLGFKDTALPIDATHMRIAMAIGQMASLVIEHAQLITALESANRLKSEFVATMSHELRTPLNVIMGYNALLREGDYGVVSEDQRDIMRRIERSSEELLELINATLDMSRLDAGRVPLDVSEVALGDVLHQVESETRHLRLRPGVVMRWEIADDLPRLRTDGGKLKVVLKNLLGNAAKFTENGSITVTASVDGESFELRVVDTGIGIPAAAQPIIFDAFRQVDGSSTRKHGGVGLGLYIVRRLVSVLGGTIDLESEEGVGSTFRVRLPIKAVDALPASATGTG